MATSLNLAVTEAVPASLMLEGPSPIALAKALKNEQELQASERREGRTSSRCVEHRVPTFWCSFTLSAAFCALSQQQLCRSRVRFVASLFGKRKSDTK